MKKLGRVLLRVTAVVCLVLAVVLVLHARPPGDSAAASTATPSLRTPAFSPRRVPQLLVDAAARNRLQADLAAAVAPYDACAVVADASGTVAAVNPSGTYAPASTLKLLTATNALATLGPDSRFTTRVQRDAAGNLILVGAGDPLLATPQYIAHEHAKFELRDAPFTPLDSLADAIARTGVRNAPAIIVNDAAQDTLRYLPDWKPTYGRDGEVGSLGALTVDGGFDDPIRQHPAPDPALTAGTRLAELLKARGVQTGPVRRDNNASGTEIAHVDSPPLSDVVGEMLRGSDNYTAEMLNRASSHETGPHTTAGGLSDEQSTLTRLGIPLTGSELHDGSGLAPDDRVRCETLLAAVRLAENNPRFAAVDRGMPVAGRSGTLAERFLGDPLAGRLRAKTGQIANVVGFAGVVDGTHPLRFAFLARGGFSTLAGQALQANVAHAVASYPNAPSTKALVPAP
jgi:D-alanyl-D-alanine carboxypeptidase/D-alanyl-D-alanine-endopeptidase (penicillin-binding protein 4)